MLIEAIKKLVKIEVEKAVQSTIKEAVTAEVNSILAEKFIATMGNRSLVNESAPMRQIQTKKPAEESIDKEARKKELLKKMGVEENPMLNMIYEGVSAEDPEEDDEGIDISQFGVFKQ